MNIQQFRQNNPDYDDLSDQELADALFTKHYSDMDRTEFDTTFLGTSAPAPAATPDDSGGVMDFLSQAYDSIKDMSVDDVTNYLKENGELPGGIGGAAVGALLGFLTPMPGGMLIGSMLGGAAGSGGGVLASDAAMGRDPNFEKAMSEAAMSLGFDVATLGLGKIAKPVYSALKAKFMSGATPESLVKELAQGPAADFGTQTARMQSQDMLQEQGLSLTPFQSGVSTSWESMKENVARTGIFSKNIFEATNTAVNDLVKDELSTLIGSGRSLSDSVVGEGIFDSLNQGRKVLNDQYGSKLTEISAKLSKDAIDLKPLKSSLSNFEKANVDALGNSILNDKTQAVIKELTGLMEDTAKAPANFLLDFDKALTKKINEVSTFGSASFDPNTARELTSLSKRVKVRIRTEITKVDKVAGADYRSLQRGFSKDITEMFPDINATFVRNANKGSYQSMGSMFSVGDKTENIQAMLRAIDTAYGKIPKSELKTLPFRSAGEAKDAIRRSYVEKQLGSLGGEALDISKFTREAKSLTDASHAAKVKTILGPNYDSYKRVVNLMAEASRKPESGMATLFQRSKEYGALVGTAVLGATGVVGGTTAAISAAAILGGPRFLARAATNPKYVNKLIQLDKLGNNPEKVFDAATLIINDVVDEALDAGLGEDYVTQMLEGF